MGRAVFLALKRVLAATAVWAALGAPSAGAEWRSWCGAEGARASLGWHFYCDREEDTREAEPAPRTVPPVVDERPATERIDAMRKALEEARATAILDPTTPCCSATSPPTISGRVRISGGW